MRICWKCNDDNMGQKLKTKNFSTSSCFHFSVTYVWLVKKGDEHLHGVFHLLIKLNIWRNFCDINASYQLRFSINRFFCFFSCFAFFCQKNIYYCFAFCEVRSDNSNPATFWKHFNFNIKDNKTISQSKFHYIIIYLKRK